MSHITAVKTELRDEVVLKEALGKIGFKIQEDRISSAETYARNKVRVDFVALRKGMELQFVRPDAGSPYDILADWHASGKRSKKVVQEILQSYSREKVLALARCKGYSVIRNTVNEKGSIEIVLRKVA